MQKLVIVWSILLFCGSCKVAQPRSQSDAVKSPGSAEVSDPLMVAGGTLYNGSGIGALGNETSGMTCSAIEIGERCLLTTSQCLDPTPTFYIPAQIANPTTEWRIPVLRNTSYDHYLDSLGAYPAVFNPSNRGARDLAMLYLSENKCPPVETWEELPQKNCAIRLSAAFPAGQKASWSPKSFGVANVGSKVTVVGYSVDEWPEISSSSVRRSGEFTLNAVTNISWYSATLNSTFLGKYYGTLPIEGSAGRVGAGDRGGPVLNAAGKVVAVAVSSDHESIPAFHAGVVDHALDWVEWQKRAFCRKIGELNLSVFNSRTDTAIQDAKGFSITWRSTDPEGTAEGNKSGVCKDSSSCGIINYINLTVEVTAPINWTFVKWKPYSGLYWCPCSGTSPKCQAKASDLTFYQEVGTSWCTAQFEQIIPTPTPSPTTTPKPSTPPTPTPSPSTTSSPRPSTSPTPTPSPRP